MQNHYEKNAPTHQPTEYSHRRDVDTSHLNDVLRHYADSHLINARPIGPTQFDHHQQQHYSEQPTHRAPHFTHLLQQPSQTHEQQFNLLQQQWPFIQQKLQASVASASSAAPVAHPTQEAARPNEGAPNGAQHPVAQTQAGEEEDAEAEEDEAEDVPGGADVGKKYIRKLRQLGEGGGAPVLDLAQKLKDKHLYGKVGELLMADQGLLASIVQACGGPWSNILDRIRIEYRHLNLPPGHVLHCPPHLTR